jgi:hypothetical protein
MSLVLGIAHRSQYINVLTIFLDVCQALFFIVFLVGFCVLTYRSAKTYCSRVKRKALAMWAIYTGP